MREALAARSDQDFVVADEPRRKPRAPRKPASARSRERESLKLAWLSVLTKRPGRTILGATAAAIVTGIVLNAVMFQTGRHPAPLFGGSKSITTQLRPAPTPVPAPRPVDLAPASLPPVSSPMQATPLSPPASIPTQASRESEPAAPVSRATPPAAPVKKDAIASLLKGDPAPAADAPSARVAAVQKALMRAGFVVRPDGVMGASTRQALERYERDHKLPVTGDLAQRTLRELSAHTGVPIP